LPFSLAPEKVVACVIAAAASPPRLEKRDRRRKGYVRRKRFLMRRDPHCKWCGIPLTMDREQVTEGLRLATLDHEIPLDAGGLDNPNNYVLACEPCNTARGNRTGPPPAAPEPAEEMRP
jgi:5-methylcytosine-specific restriction endonuclease McrA